MGKQNHNLVVIVHNVVGDLLLERSFRSTNTIRTIKQLLQKSCGVPLFRQQLLVGTALTDDEDILIHQPQRLAMTLVVLPVNPEMNQPLLTSAIEGNVASAKQALRKRADPNCSDAAQRTPLFCAAQTGHCGVVNLLLDARADIDSSALGGVCTPLAVAAARGHLTVTVRLVIAGADKDIQAHSRVTPLWLAARHGHAKVVRYLCRVGATIDKPAPRGPRSTRLHPTVYHPGGSSPLWIAAADRQFGIVKLLCEAGADHKQPNQDGVTPLSVSFRRGFASDWSSIGLSMYLLLLAAKDCLQPVASPPHCAKRQ